MPVGFRFLRLLLAAVLLLAASLKLYGWAVDPVASVGLFSARWFQTLVIQFEFLLGLWLLSGHWQVGAWLASSVTFAVFAAFSFYAGWIGQATCGCFGAITVSPWLAFAVDLAALLLLLALRPNFDRVAVTSLRVNSARSATRAVAIPLGIGLVGFVTVLGITTWVRGSPEGALAWLRGEPITTSPSYVDFGSGQPGDALSGVVEVRNWTGRPVRLIGGSSACVINVTTDMPLTIPPGESRSISLRLFVPKSEPGALSLLAELWTDCDDQRTIPVRVECRVE